MGAGQFRLGVEKVNPLRTVRLIKNFNEELRAFDLPRRKNSEHPLLLSPLLPERTCCPSYSTRFTKVVMGRCLIPSISLCSASPPDAAPREIMGCLKRHVATNRRGCPRQILRLLSNVPGSGLTLSPGVPGLPALPRREEGFHPAREASTRDYLFSDLHTENSHLRKMIYSWARNLLPLLHPFASYARCCASGASELRSKKNGW